jgi:uncharacterized membrane protein
MKMEIQGQPKFQHHTTYTVTEATALVIIVVIIIIVIVIGNLLVILAIFRDTSLKNIQNWFIGE